MAERRGLGPVPKNPEGEIAARVFELFEQRKTVREIVIELRVPPALVRQLYDEYASPDELLLPTRIVRTFRDSVFDGKPFKPRDLMLRFDHLVQRLRAANQRARELQQECDLLYQTLGKTHRADASSAGAPGPSAGPVGAGPQGPSEPGRSP